MEPPPQESAASRIKRVFDWLVSGQAYADKLKDFLVAALGNNLDSEGEQIGRDLIEKVRSSFDNALAVLSHDEFEEVSQVVTVAGPPMKRGKPNASEDSEGSVRSSLPTQRDRRGCYKRRSKGATWTKFTPSMTADDHQWRKYGQKRILNAAHPRHYYRCTHKSDQDCMATKQVQKIYEDPISFRTVYQGHHTCRDAEISEIVTDNDGSNNLGSGVSPVLISFKRNESVSAPLKNEETSEGFLGNKVAVIPSASSDHEHFNIFGPTEDISNISSYPEEVFSSGHQGSSLNMAMDWMADFALDYGSAGGI